MLEKKRTARPAPYGFPRAGNNFYDCPKCGNPMASVKSAGSVDFTCSMCQWEGPAVTAQGSESGEELYEEEAGF